MVHSFVKTALIFLLIAVTACTPLANQTTNTTLTFTNLTDTSTTQQQPTQPVPAVDQNFSARLTYTEGDLIQLKPLVKDPDNDKVQLSFSQPFDQNGVWQTKVGDAGDYPVIITATDTKGASATTKILVTIKYANRPPVINCPDTVEANEGQVVTLNCTASDPDGDDTILSFSGYMQGPTHQTTYDDAGDHTVLVSAEDGKTSTTKNVTITVHNVNRPPVLHVAQTTFQTTELQAITIPATATDPDGDNVTITYGNPLSADGSWTPQLDQAGNYTVTITASDGTDSTTQDVQLTVLRADRPPTITVPTADGKVHVKEGDFIDLRKLVNISDAEGEQVIATYRGWMNEPTYQTTYDDAGTHVVTITANDNVTAPAKADITIVVDDVNRPPVFIRPA